MPVLLDQMDYDALLLVNQMAQVPELLAGAPIASTAALTQDELARVYRLPQRGDEESHAVVNGQVVRLNDKNYELFQVIRGARHSVNKKDPPGRAGLWFLPWST